MAEADAAAPVAPVPAATLMLLRDGAAGLEVLMITRHDASGFAAGALVFPGGKVDAADAGLRPHCPGTGNFDDVALALRVAAIRETFEEGGILLARSGGRALDPDRVAALSARGGGFAALVAEAGLEVEAASLVRFAHWITPPARARRYDTHFFLAPAPAGQVARHDGREAVANVWITPAQALADGEASRRALVFPTYMNLSKLGRYRTTAEALAAAEVATIVTVTPETGDSPQGPVIRIPEAADYGRTQMLAALTRRS